MKTIVVILQMLLLLLSMTGCEQANTKSPSKTDSGSNHRFSETATEHLVAYGPAKVDIMPLTEFAGDDKKPSNIKVYVSLLDAFDCQIKTPTVFRFELYDVVPLSADPKGSRVLIWPDIDLNDAAQNNEYWRDFLRAYEFNLPFESENGKNYILHVTSLCPNGRRLSDDFTLKQYTNPK